MFKSIQIKLYLYTALLIGIVAALTYFILNKEFVWTFFFSFFLIVCLILMNNTYKKFNSNILFLLNALDNGDYSFHFSETKLSRREQELNVMLNRIKEILANARTGVIENERYLSIIIESVSTGIFIVDERGIVQSVNQPALTILGLPNFTHLNQLQTINANFPKLFHNLKPQESIQIKIPNEKEEQQIIVQASEIKLNRGLMQIITLNNIGNELESKEMESWIRLIRVMTHEIMNSVAPITSLSETMLSLLHLPEKDVDAKQLRENTLEAMETINTTAKGLLNFVESYRKFTTIPQPSKRNFSIRELIESNVKLFEYQIKEKQIDLLVDFGNSPEILYADKHLINQVLVNLIKNAIEAVDAVSGRVKILITSPNQKELTVHVQNNGAPIPEDVLPHIFIPFFTTKSDGSGIGLSISRYIVRLHGGKLIHSLSPEGETVFSMVF